MSPRTSSGIRVRATVTRLNRSRLAATLYRPPTVTEKSAPDDLLRSGAGPAALASPCGAAAQVQTVRSAEAAGCVVAVRMPSWPTDSDHANPSRAYKIWRRSPSIVTLPPRGCAVALV